MRAALTASLLLAAACASTRPESEVGETRRLNEESLPALAAALDAPGLAGRWIVVERGAVVSASLLPDDAIRAADAKSAPTSHRYVFRNSDRGRPLYRMAYVAEGGVVAGRRFLADLGLEATVPAGRRPLLRRKSGGTSVDLATSPRLVVELTSLDGRAHRTIDAAFDPDFDGGLLVPRELAESLTLARFEIPTGADVQIALGRPFRAHRATALARIPALSVSAPAEVLYEAPVRPK